ncbi:MAG: hypothetical protein P4L99_09135 [Chthoniobacter sp.]|nr:hypothetical protein [Chthoniobacter sp.]
MATSEDVKPWQLAFFAGWESFMRQTQHLSDRVRFHPRRASSEAEPVPQEEDDRHSLDPRRLPMVAPSAEQDASRRRRRLLLAILGLIGCALLITVILFASH